MFYEKAKQNKAKQEKGLRKKIYIKGDYNVH